MTNALVRMKIPYAYARSLDAIDPLQLHDAGCRGLLVDIDNTLIGFDSEQPKTETLAWVARAKAAGLAIVLLSNNFSHRVERVARTVECAAVPNALKPLPFGYLRALAMLGTTRQTTVIIGDQLMTDIIGAAALGIRGVLVNPIAEKDFPLTRILRTVERVLVGSKRPI